MAKKRNTKIPEEVEDTLRDNTSKTVVKFVSSNVFSNPNKFFPLKDIESDPSVQAIKELVDNINAGTEIPKTQELKIASLIHGQDDRAEIISKLYLTHEYGRLAKFLKLREKVEDMLFKLINTATLSPPEIMAIHQLLTGEINSIAKNVKAGSASVKDLFGLLNKINFQLIERDDELKKEYAGTTGQEREIMRKIAYGVKKMTQEAEENIKNE